MTKCGGGTVARVNPPPLCLLARAHGVRALVALKHALARQQRIGAWLIILRIPDKLSINAGGY